MLRTLDCVCQSFHNRYSLWYRQVYKSTYNTIFTILTHQIAKFFVYISHFTMRTHQRQHWTTSCTRTILRDMKCSLKCVPMLVYRPGVHDNELLPEYPHPPKFYFGIKLPIRKAEKVISLPERQRIQQFKEMPFQEYIS